MTGTVTPKYAIEKNAAIVDCGTGFCCQKCGKDLTLTLTDVQTIYGTEATSEYVTHLNTALKKGGFNTCISHAHFFSQSQAEVGSDFHLDEIPNYRLHTVKLSKVNLPKRLSVATT